MRLMGRSIVVGALMALATQMALAEEGRADDSRGSARMRVYIDPETGEMTAPPPGEAADPADDGALLQGVPAEDALVEEVNPAGGYSVDLQRRFGGVARAVAAPDGAVAVDCEAGEKPAGK